MVKIFAVKTKKLTHKQMSYDRIRERSDILISKNMYEIDN